MRQLATVYGYDIYVAEIKGKKATGPRHLYFAVPKGEKVTEGQEVEFSGLDYAKMIQRVREAQSIL